jgi:hypothetical protein
MRNWHWQWWVLFAGAVAAFAQSNAPVASSGLFSVSPIQLRAEPAMAEANPPAKACSTEAERMELDTERLVRSLDRYRWMNGTECLTRPEFHDRTLLDAIFEPEVIRLRKVDLGGSLITAIKRKNPLCLLNPIVFWMSW